MKKERLIEEFESSLWQNRNFNDAEKPPWENVSVIDLKECSANGEIFFLALVNRKLQSLHKLADYETFEYVEIYKLKIINNKITYNLLHRSLFLHVYTYDGFPGLFNTRRYEKKELFYNPEKKIKKIVSNMKFLSESTKVVSLKIGEIQKFKDFVYRYRCK